ncbi:hypothetical protein HJFPF1_11795 [Paramyrothecium foliicola]|nr:hypothetical protein HJFPF1_11795 [Paramyrothecium foliicola]
MSRAPKYVGAIAERSLDGVAQVESRNKKESAGSVQMLRAVALTLLASRSLACPPPAHPLFSLGQTCLAHSQTRAFTTTAYSMAETLNSKAQPEEAAAPQLSARDFQFYNSMAEKMDYIHGHFREMWKIMWDACESGRRPKNMTIRQFLNHADSFVQQLTGHHDIEESLLYPRLAPRLKHFDPKNGDLVVQHKAIHDGMDRLQKYVLECKAGTLDFSLAVLKEKMQSFGDVLWVHLDEEVEALGAVHMAKAFTKEEFMRPISIHQEPPSPITRSILYVFPRLISFLHIHSLTHPIFNPHAVLLHRSNISPAAGYRPSAQTITSGSGPFCMLHCTVSGAHARFREKFLRHDADHAASWAAAPRRCLRPRSTSSLLISRPTYSAHDRTLMPASLACDAGEKPSTFLLDRAVSCAKATALSARSVADGVSPFSDLTVEANSFLRAKYMPTRPKRRFMVRHSPSTAPSALSRAARASARAASGGVGAEDSTTVVLGGSWNASATSLWAELLSAGRLAASSEAAMKRLAYVTNMSTVSVLPRACRHRARCPRKASSVAGAAATTAPIEGVFLSAGGGGGADELSASPEGSVAMGSAGVASTGASAMLAVRLNISRSRSRWELR